MTIYFKMLHNILNYIYIPMLNTIKQNCKLWISYCTSFAYNLFTVSYIRVIILKYNILKQPHRIHFAL